MTAVPDLTSDTAASGTSPVRPELTVVPGARTPADTVTAPHVEIVIPAYNEAERLPRTVDATVEYLLAQPWRSRILVVDNGSSDRTARIVQEHERRGRLPVRLIGCARPGKGAAVRRGLLRTEARFVGFVDADLATPIDTLGETVRILEGGAAAVIASRHVRGATLVRPQPLARRVGGAVFRRMTQDIVSGVHDTQCGFKFFEREAVLRALTLCRTTGFAFDVELLRRIQEGGGAIVEVPVAWTDDPASTFRPIHDGAASFAALLALRKG